MSEAFQPDQFLSRLNGQLSHFEREELRDQLAFYINHLLLNDFNKLVQLLYTVDVDESNLKAMLIANSDTDASLVIADLLIKRQEEKILQRRSTGSNNNIPDEDRW